MAYPVGLGVLRRSGYRDLLAGQAVSALGDWMGTVALMALTLELTGSATAVSGILVLRLLPATVAGPLAARAATRWDRRRIMLTTDLVRAGFVAAIPLVQELWWIYFWAFMVEAAGLVFLPARDASLPDLVDHEDLPTANGLVMATSYGNIPLGAAAFALLDQLRPESGYLAEHPGALPLWVDALTFLVSFAFLRRLVGLGALSPAGRERERVQGSMWSAVRLPVVRSVLPALGTVFLGIGALFSLGIVYVSNVLDAGSAQFGFLVALFGAGGAGGWLLVQRLGESGPSLNTIRSAVAAMGVVLALMSLASTIALAYLAAVPFGLAAAAALIAGVTFLQERLGAERRVLGLAAFHVVLRIGMSLAAIGAGLAASAISPITWPLIGELQPAQMVLLCAGLLMFGGSLLMPRRLPSTPAEAS